MSHFTRLGVKEARRRLRALLVEAQLGQSNVITRHGRAIAAIVPLACATDGNRQKSLLGPAGSGKGLWGKDSTKTLRRLREEWQR